MLEVRIIDAVKLHWNINKHDAGLFMVLIDDIAQHHQAKVKKVLATHNNPSWGVRLWLNIDGKRLQLGVMRSHSSAWIEYGFKGMPNVQKFDEATLLFYEKSFGNAFVKASVKRFEMAVDYSGLLSSQFISHYKGARKSCVKQSNKSIGKTQYSGSAHSRYEFVVYDKAHEVTDKGGTPICEKLLRMELRIHNRKETLLHVLDEVIKYDPFQNIRIVNKEVALKHKTEIKDWPLFISACALFGTAIALQKFPSHKKSFLKILKELSMNGLRPRLEDFDNSLCFLLNNWKMSDCGLAMGFGIAHGNQLQKSSQHNEKSIKNF
jgi:hypothetical protein